MIDAINLFLTFLILCGTMLAVVCALAMVFIKTGLCKYTLEYTCTGDCNQGRNCTCAKLEKE